MKHIQTHLALTFFVCWCFEPNQPKRDDIRADALTPLKTKQLNTSYSNIPPVNPQRPKLPSRREKVIKPDLEAYLPPSATAVMTAEGARVYSLCF